ncbi:hypothetical protein EH183_17890 [Streptomyces sp. CB01881]|nr:hypothetical protein C2142_17910 [Streptomyces sp. CB01881]TYC75199.1 hypothetical protein EH183_17890 [Streptomyces sp. CB01881]
MAWALDGVTGEVFTERLVPAPVRQRGEQGNRRLHQRWAALDARRKRSTIAVVAVAREMSGWCWSLATMDP